MWAFGDIPFSSHASREVWPLAIAVLLFLTMSVAVPLLCRSSAMRSKKWWADQPVSREVTPRERRTINLSASLAMVVMLVGTGSLGFFEGRTIFMENAKDYR